MKLWKSETLWWLITLIKEESTCNSKNVNTYLYMIIETSEPMIIKLENANFYISLFCMGGYNYTKLLKEHFDTQFHTQPFYITQYNVI